MQRQVLPIVYEDNDPAKIRAAFKAGCGGVIVNSTLPDVVTVEIKKLEDDRQLQKWLKGESLALEMDAQARRRWSRDMPELIETCRWLDEEFAALSAHYLTPPVPYQGSRHLLSVWSGEGLSLPWHVDKKPSDVSYPDTHIHLHGAGLVVAVPSRPLTLLFNDAGASPQLQIPGSRYIGESEEALDEHLRDQGVEFISLKPGQRLYFRDACLHKSSFTFPAAFKLRAAIF